MDSFSSILKSPYYFGEISEEKAKNILMKEPPHTYLFRRLRNGTITIVMIQEHLGEKELSEMVVKNSYGIKLSLPKEKQIIFQTFERFQNFLAFFEKCRPAIRKNPLPLEEIAKSFVANTYKNSIDQLEIPKTIKKELKSLTSFEKEQPHYKDRVDLYVSYHYAVKEKTKLSFGSSIVRLKDNKDLACSSGAYLA